MTAVTDAGTVLDVLVGRTTTAAERGRVADAFVAADPHSLAAFAIPGNPTTEEKAQLFLDTFLTWGRQVVRTVAEGSEQETVDGQVEGAGDSAVDDLTQKE